MKSIFLRMTLNQRLAAVALVLGAIALFGNPFPDHAVRVNAQELMGLVDREADHITAEELATWIIEGRADYRLVDLREAEAFASYHIPTAEHVPVAAIADADLSRNEKIVLYSNGGIHSAQAWLLMRASGYSGAYTLLGGLQAWKDEVLFPTAQTSASAQEQARFERAAQVSAFFGGRPVTDSPDPGVVREIPEVQMPAVEAPTGGGPATRRKKTAREGC